jgi:3-methyladenine DNA glycosylase AlkD
MNYSEVLRELQSKTNPAALKGMAGFGIRTEKALGISMPFLRGLAKRIGRDHPLALRLWKSGIHEARILAALVDDPAAVSSAQMDAWAKDFDSWDVCDQVCGNLFDRTRFAPAKAKVWARRKEEFIRRAGFALMAALAWHDKSSGDDLFLGFLPAIEKFSVDDRHFVKKAVNWALRNIGKRNRALNRAAVACARRIARQETTSARWIASDAIRELTNPKTLARM